jgi:hypothetical protein
LAEFFGFRALTLSDSWVGGDCEADKSGAFARMRAGSRCWATDGVTQVEKEETKIMIGILGID